MGAISSGNRLLSFLTANLGPRLNVRTEHFPLGELLFRDDDVPEDVYFPHSGSVASIIRTSENGSTVEVGVVGSEGFFSVQSLLRPTATSASALVQGGGKISFVNAAQLRDECQRDPSLERYLLPFVSFFIDQISQNALCNRLHLIEARLAKWLLMMRDRVGSDELRITHDSISHMLGVHRSGATVAIGALAVDGVVSHSRNRISIRDMAGLKDVSCECYEVIRTALATAEP